jgi:hypothetical protein
MNPAVLSALPATLYSADFPRYMWLGNDGNVYTGQSTLIDPVQNALTLSWTVPLNTLRQSTDPADCVRPMDDVIISQYAQVKKSSFPPSSIAWEALTSARLSDESFVKLVGDAAYAIEGQIEKQIPNYTYLVADLQMAILRRALHNRGVLPTAFVNAINLKDLNIVDSDIDERLMLQNAQAVVDQGIDPSVLIYPNTAPVADFPTDYTLEQPVPTFKNYGKGPSLWDAALQANPSFSADENNEAGNQVTFQNQDSQPSLPKAASTGVLDSGGFDIFGVRATQAAIREAAQEAAAAARAVPLELSSGNQKLETAVDALKDVRDDVNKVASSTSDQIQTGLLVGGSLFLMKVIYDLVTGSKTASK